MHIKGFIIRVDGNGQWLAEVVSRNHVKTLHRLPTVAAKLNLPNGNN